MKHQIHPTMIVSIAVNIILGAVVAYALYAPHGTFLRSSAGASVPGLEYRSRRVAFIELEHSSGIDLMRKGIAAGCLRNGEPQVCITTFDANGDKIRLAALIEEAIEKNYELLMPFGSMASQLTKEIAAKRGYQGPIVFCGIGDPVKIGLTIEDGKPYKNITGQCVVGFFFVEPMIERLPYFFPKARSILMPYDPTALGGTLDAYRAYIQEQLERRGYTVKAIQIFKKQDVVQMIQPFMEQYDLVWILPDATVLDAMEGIGKLCARYTKPSYVTMNINALQDGAAVAFGYMMEDLGFELGRYLVRLLVDGESVSNLPVLSVEPRHLKIGINVENAKKQGLVMPSETLYLMEHGMVWKSELCTF